jgi:hypothetical protein
MSREIFNKNENTEAPVAFSSLRQKDFIPLPKKIGPLYYLIEFSKEKKN